MLACPVRGRPQGRPEHVFTPLSEMTVSDSQQGVQVGQKVEDFTLETYNAAEGDFGTFNLADNMKKDRWTALFFYPADFTFV